MFPNPVPVARQPCERCRTPTRVDRLVAGRFGADCAALLGLTVSTPRLRADPQTGLNLLDLIDDEPEDHCDGYDR